jgi:hypothetical protein
MRGSLLLSLLLATAAAAPIREHSQELVPRYIPNYPGLQFNSDKKLSVTVFSDLHFGERESSVLLLV